MHANSKPVPSDRAHASRLNTMRVRTTADDLLVPSALTQRGGGASDDPIYVSRDFAGPAELCLHYVRNDVILATVYWDDAESGPPREQGWFAVVNGAEIHNGVEGDGPGEWEAVVGLAYRYLKAQGALRSMLSPLQSRQMLWWTVSNPDGTPTLAATDLERVDVDLRLP